MCDVQYMVKKGTKAMSLIVTKFGFSSAVSRQTPAFAGGAGIHAEKKTGSREKKK